MTTPLSAFLSELLPPPALPTPGPSTMARLAGAFAWAPSPRRGGEPSPCPSEEEARLEAMAAVPAWEVEPESGPVSTRGGTGVREYIEWARMMGEA